MINLSFQDDEKCKETAANRLRIRREDDKIWNVDGDNKLNDNGEVEKADHLAKDYDPYDHGNNENPTSFVAVVLHLCVISLGPTMMSIPATFVDVGYAIGFVGTLLAVLFYAYSLRTIVSAEYELCKRLKTPNMTYIQLVYNAFDTGPRRTRWLAAYTKYVIYACSLAIWVGGNSAFLLLGCDNMKNVYEYVFHADVSVRSIMICLTVPLVLLCWIPNLKLLSLCSAFATLINAISIAAIMREVFRDFPPPNTRLRSTGNLSDVPFFLGTILFTINATGLVMPLKNEMRFPKRFNSGWSVLKVTYIPVSLLYAVFSFLCFVRYGDDVKDNVILNLSDNAFSKIVIGLYGLGVCLLYPLVSYVSFDIVWNNVLKEKLVKSNHYLLYEYVTRTVIALSSVALAFIVPNIGLFLSLTGTVCTSLDSIIFPALVEILVHSKERSYLLFAKNAAILVVAALLVVTGSVDCASRIIEYYSK